MDAKLDRIIDVLIAKADTKRVDEFERKMDKRFQEVMSAIDALTKAVSDLTMEYASVKMQLTRHEEWFKILAKKAGVKLPQHI